MSYVREWKSRELAAIEFVSEQRLETIKVLHRQIEVLRKELETERREHRRNVMYLGFIAVWMSVTAFVGIII